MRTLIGMTDFVLEQNKEVKSQQEQSRAFYHCCNYANFLKQPLALWMFRPCKLVDGVWVVLEEPQIFIDIRLEEYQQAKERCLFEEFEWNVAQFCDEPMIELNDKNGNYLVYDVEDKNFQNADELFFETIEDLVKYKPLLTPTTQKQIGL